MNIPPTKWTLEFTIKANREFKKLDREIYNKVRAFIDASLLTTENPRRLGKPLSGNMREFWRYRIGDYRVICEIHDHILIIVAVRVAHRREVYKKLHLVKPSL